jgi:CheY-like chemotaxis protein
MSAETLHILVIDDNRTDFLLMEDLLEELGDEGVRVDWAPTYEEGLESACSGDHDLCFVDHNLGVRTGIDLIRAVVGHGASTPMVLLTGAETDRVAEDAKAAGAAQFLAKEALGLKVLEETLRNITGKENR